MIKFNDFAERYADVITVTKKRTPHEPDLSGVGDYRLPDIGHNKDYYEIRQDVQDDIWNHYDCRT